MVDEIVVRETDGARYQIGAKFFEDDRGITHLTLQRFNAKEPSKEIYFTFRGPEITQLLEFIAGVRTVPLPTPGKRHVNDDELREIVLDRSQLRRVLSNSPELLAEALQRDDFKRDFHAVGFRRNQLKRFHDLLHDAAFFESEKAKVGKPETVWQRFFEANKWIFGYGLAYQAMGPLDGKALEQVVRGFSLTGPGKRTDAVMKTQGLVNSLCFVEIKHHNTSLLTKDAYRSGAWSPHAELVGGIAQVQATVQDAVETIVRKLEPTGDDGAPTGETLFNFEPRAFLVAGSLGQFETDAGINEQKFRSFELFRRNTKRPEILTFDELYHRAKFIVEQDD